MSDRKLYQQKKLAQLDGWKAGVAKLKEKASSASADARQQFNKQIEGLEGKIEEGKTQLAEMAGATEDAWESVKDRLESTWDSMKSAFSDAEAKLKE